MNAEKYNGWTNRETWLVNLHFDNMIDNNVTEWFHNLEQQDIKPSRQEIADYLKDLFEDGYFDLIEQQLKEMQFGSFISDLLDFSKIDWYDLAENYYEEPEDEIAIQE